MSKGEKLFAYLLNHGALYDDQLGYWLNVIVDEDFDQAIGDKKE